MASISGEMMFLHAVWRFCLMFFASAGIGVVFALVSTIISLLYSQLVASTVSHTNDCVNSWFSLCYCCPVALK